MWVFWRILQNNNPSFKLHFSMKKGGLLYIFAYPIGAERHHSLISTAGTLRGACLLCHGTILNRTLRDLSV